jgi:ABC-type spermidine/putrescine transport system permease subunit I
MKMLENWLATSNWSQEQWLIASILAFVVVATLVVIYRLYAIFKMSTRKRERPNLRGGRRLRR